MADFSLTTLFVVPVGQTTFPSSGSTQALTAGQVGIFTNTYAAPTGVNAAAQAASLAAVPYFYVAQGRTNTYLQGSKRSDKISGRLNTGSKNVNVTEWYKTVGNATAVTQITEVDNWTVKCGEVVTLTLRAHSSYLDTLYFNGFTRSVTVQAPCCDCGGDPCTDVDAEALVAQFITKLQAGGPGINPDNITLTDFFTFTSSGTGAATKLVITGKALTRYAQPCDVAAFPWEYDRMYFRTFVYSGPATTADFIVADNCNPVADVAVTQNATYPSGSADEVIQLEKNFYSYQAGYLKHLYRMVGYNENFESWVTSGTVYNLFYIKFNEYDRTVYQWGDYIHEDSMVIIAIPQGAGSTALQTILEGALGTVTTI